MCLLYTKNGWITGGRIGELIGKLLRSVYPAVGGVIKLRRLSGNIVSGKHSPISLSGVGVKPIWEYPEKMIQNILKKIWLGMCKTIAGLRIMVQFVDDTSRDLEVLRQRRDMRVVQERDHITTRSRSGLGYHVVGVQYPVDTIGKWNDLSRIQIRTLVHEFWATIELLSIINIKGAFRQRSKKRSETTAKPGTSLLDEEMRAIRDANSGELKPCWSLKCQLNDGVGNGIEHPIRRLVKVSIIHAIASVKVKRFFHSNCAISFGRK